MRTPVETVSPEATARAAAGRLVEEGIGSLVVCEDGEPVGIVTEVDVAELVSAGRDPEATTVREFMTSPLITTSASASIEEAAQTMLDQDIKRLPVVDGGDVVGIVTTTDLANFLPHLVKRGERQYPDEHRERKSVRVDTAYEDDDWEFEYLGGEASIEVGDTVRFAKTLTAEDVDSFAEASGDTNRLHLDDEYAAETRFGERIAHGALVGGVVSAALARLPGLIIYLSQDVSYLGPVPLGSRVAAECEVVENIGKGRFRLATTVQTGGPDEDGETVIDGEAVVISDPIPDSE
ncbi:CBS domain-containing protein [Halobacteriales archaeon Cl-PHB]